LLPSIVFRLSSLLCLLALLGLGLPTASAAGDFADWHLPLPAGEWAISRGPCGSAALFDHECRYYENRCAVDFVPTAGSMQNVPVLAPQAGRVFFIGARAETGLFLMLLHPDNYVSGYMHLSQAAVGLDEDVTRGQVIGYAGQSGTTRAHLHFFIQRNAVERECVMPEGLDVLEYRTGRAVSRNLAWPALTLPDPPALPDWLPTLSLISSPLVILPGQVTLRPGATASVPVFVRGQFTATDSLSTGGALLSPLRQTAGYTLFNVPIAAPRRAGMYSQRLELRAASRRLTAVLRYTVRVPPETKAGEGVLLVNPELASPAGWSYLSAPPKVCWRVTASDGQAPLRYRVIAVGPTPVDSGWINDTCWQMPTLKRGAYLWKAFVRDARGYMNRTNQRPFAFVIR
jgi:murein DD-endopeptidase MepM/ murein hydrolase activator NlpD